MSTPHTHEQDSENSGTGNMSASAHPHRDEGYVFSTRQPPNAALSPTEQRLAELLATISHEFRTPLTVINGYTSTLLRRTGELSREEHDEFLQIIQQASTHMEFLMSRLLEITELEAGSVQIEWRPVDIPALAREAITLASRHISEPLRDHFTFHLQCRDEAGKRAEEIPLVKGDGQRLYEVLGHLLENAIRYSPKGGSIDVVLRPALQERMDSGHNQVGDTSSFLEICISDFGLGIADEHLERIFERFYRVDTSLTREVYGLGLGLTICDHLVTLHHGRMWAESCLAGGSAFHVWLPCEEWPATR